MSTTNCCKGVDQLESRVRDRRTISRQKVYDRLPAGVQPAADLQITVGNAFPYAPPIDSRLSPEIIHALRGALAPAMMVASHMENDRRLALTDREDAAMVGRSLKAALDIIQTLRQDSAFEGERS